MDYTVKSLKILEEHYLNLDLGLIISSWITDGTWKFIWIFGHMWRKQITSKKAAF